MSKKIDGYILKVENSKRLDENFVQVIKYDETPYSFYLCESIIEATVFDTKGQAETYLRWVKANEDRLVITVKQIKFLHKKVVSGVIVVD